jgi:hypothetical protein
VRGAYGRNYFMMLQGIITAELDVKIDFLLMASPPQAGTADFDRAYDSGNLGN